MGRRFHLGLTFGDERHEFHGEVPDEELMTLTHFLEMYRRLENTGLAQGGSIDFSLNWSCENGLSASGALPSSDSVDAFIYRLRPFVLKDEPTYFHKVCGIIRRHLEHPKIGELLRLQSDVFSGKEFQELVRITMGGRVLNGEDTLMLWLNSAGEYHSDPKKRDRLRDIHAPLEQEAMKPFFVSMLMDKAKAVSEVALLVRLLTESHPKGTEVRFRTRG